MLLSSGGGLSFVTKVEADFHDSLDFHSGLAISATDKFIWGAVCVKTSNSVNVVGFTRCTVSWR